MTAPRLTVVSPGVSPPPGPAVGDWQGGRYRTAKGKTTFYIRRRLGSGERFEKAVASASDPKVAESRAMAELALFEASPESYKPPKERAASAQAERSMSTGGAVCLDADTLQEFFDHCQALVDKGEMSKVHRNGTLVCYLTQWAKVLGGRDLHTLTLDELQAALARDDWQAAQHKRVVALKSFAAWARTVKRAPKLRRQADPTLDLLTPKPTNRKKSRRKGYPMALIQKLYRDLDDQTARDMIRLRACANGVHETEIVRIARGEAELKRIDDPSGIAGVIEFWQAKKQEWHRVSVDAPTFAAAVRLAARGAAHSTGHLHKLITEVVVKWHGCGGVVKEYSRKPTGKGAVVRKFRPCKGCVRIHPNELRASFATWMSTDGEEIKPAGKKGVPLEVIAERMGHLDKRTTWGNYVGEHVPNMLIVPALRLQHPEDPA